MHWNRLSRKVLDASSPEVFRAKLDGVWATWSREQGLCTWLGVRIRWSLTSPPTEAFLWFYENEEIPAFIGVYSWITLDASIPYMHKETTFTISQLILHSACMLQNTVGRQESSEVKVITLLVAPIILTETGRYGAVTLRACRKKRCAQRWGLKVKLNSSLCLIFSAWNWRSGLI